tara:strand:- start:142 stop:444 length:303 start_codon:yes stop_codon:yes gene_type:complete
MISTEDIKRLKQEKDRVEKNATHQDTPITHQKNTSYRNTHHTRQGGRTDLSTSSQGLSPSGTDRVMGVLRDVCIVVWGYMGIVLGRLMKEIKLIKDILWK